MVVSSKQGGVVALETVVLHGKPRACGARMRFSPVCVLTARCAYKRLVAASRRWVCSNACCSAACAFCGLCVEGSLAVVSRGLKMDCVVVYAVVYGNEKLHLCLLIKGQSCGQFVKSKEKIEERKRRTLIVSEKTPLNGEKEK